MKKWAMFLGVCLTALSLAACSSGSEGSQEVKETAVSSVQGTEGQEKSGGASSLTPAEVTVASTAEGLEQFRTLVKDLKRQVEANETQPAVETTRQLLGIWKAIQGDFSASKPEAVKEIENQLAQLGEAVQAEPWDSALLIKIDYQLYQEARKLE